MKIYQDRQFDKNTVNFKAGLNVKITNEIQQINTERISESFFKNGVETDFKGDKTVAWCCHKLDNVFRQLNNKYRLEISMPKAIFVEDFSKLKVDDRIISFCNWFKAPLLKDSDRCFTEKTLFFNSNFLWRNINSETEKNYQSGFWSNNHFLTNFVHEFIHVAHNGHLLQKFPPAKLHAKLINITEKQYCEKYKARFPKILSGISQKAAENPLETLAESMSSKIIESFQSSNFDVIENPFKGIINNNKKLGSCFNTDTNILLKKIWDLDL